MLQIRGHTVSGISLNPSQNSLFVKAEIGKIFKNEIRQDIRNYESLKKEFMEINPDVVIHLAAQPLVRESYKNPKETYETNIIGTLNVLNASNHCENLKAQLIITTDKVYKNNNQIKGYLETDLLGGNDPYSASKSAADEITQTWLRNVNAIPTGIARAGNVIGGGDFNKDRLVPDLVESFIQGNAPVLRNPQSIRPWQHVLDCLSGYLDFIDMLLKSGKSEILNFGPSTEEIYTVEQVLLEMSSYFPNSGEWIFDKSNNPHESEILLLNSNKARRLLDWKDKLNFHESIRWTAEWYKKISKGMDAFSATIIDIENFEKLI